MSNPNQTTSETKNSKNGKVDVRSLSSFNREKNIMRALASGPSTKNWVYENFFRNNGKLVSRQFFSRVIKRMLNNEQLISKQYVHPVDKRKRLTVYALGPVGVNEMCLNYAFEREHIRAYLPALRTLRHDLYMSEIIRVIQKEEAEKKRYKIKTLYDELVMRRIFARQKGIFYPDLKGMLAPSSNSKDVEFNLELDTGEKGGRYWLKKLRNWNSGTTLVLCLNSERKKMLMDYIRNNRMPVEVCFALAEEFIRQENGKILGGLVDTVWTIWSDKGKDTGKLPL